MNFENDDQKKTVSTCDEEVCMQVKVVCILTPGQSPCADILQAHSLRLEVSGRQEVHTKNAQIERSLVGNA